MGDNTSGERSTYTLVRILPLVSPSRPIVRQTKRFGPPQQPCKARRSGIRAPRNGSGAERQPARPRLEAELDERSDERRGDRRLAVDPLQRELADAPGAHRLGERPQRLGNDLARPAATPCCPSSTSVIRPRPPRSTYSTGSSRDEHDVRARRRARGGAPAPRASATAARRRRAGRGRRRRARACAPARPRRAGAARSRSTAPGSANCAPPRPSTK